MNKISLDLLSRHSLSLDQFSLLRAYGLEQLSQKRKLLDCFYRSTKETRINRAVLINFSEKSFTILSKRYGSVYKTNSLVKKFSIGIEVKLNQITEVARLVNKENQEITTREIGYERRFGEVRSLATYTSKKGIAKKTYTQTLYTNTLCAFSRSKTPFCPRSIIHSITDQIVLMHSQGIVHGDLKLGNVLYRNSLVKVGDFGCTFAPNDEEPFACSEGYGTLAYSAPEHLPQNQADKLEDSLEQAKADDLFAIGCMWYELTHKKEVPWAAPMNDCLMVGDPTIGEKAFSRLVLERNKLLLDSNIECAKVLFCLLDPLPKNRINAFELQKKLQTVDKKPAEDGLILLAKVCEMARKVSHIQTITKADNRLYLLNQSEEIICSSD